MGTNVKEYHSNYSIEALLVLPNNKFFDIIKGYLDKYATRPTTNWSWAEYNAEFSDARYDEIFICVGRGKEVQIPYEDRLAEKLLPDGVIVELEFDFLL